MAAPNLQAEGATSATSNGTAPSVTIPTHVANDILIVHAVIWSPNTGGGSGDVAQIPTPSGWTLAGSQVGQPASSPRDGWSAVFWKRATGAGTTVTLTEDAGWDTGNDSCMGARAYVVRGCALTGDPWDAVVQSVAHTTANQAFAAVTVSGSERTVIQFGGMQDNVSFSMVSSGWSNGTEDNDAAGTDCSFQTAYKANISSSTTADTATVTQPGNGSYVFHGISFKPETIVTTTATGKQSTGGSDATTKTSSQSISVKSPLRGLSAVAKTVALAAVASIGMSGAVHSGKLCQVAGGYNGYQYNYEGYNGSNLVCADTSVKAYAVTGNASPHGTVASAKLALEEEPQSGDSSSYGHIAAAKTVPYTASGKQSTHGQAVSGRHYECAIVAKLATGGSNAVAKTVPNAVSANQSSHGQDATTKTLAVTVSGTQSSQGQDATTKTSAVAVVGDSSSQGQSTAEQIGAGVITTTVQGEGSSGGAIASSKTALQTIVGEQSSQGQDASAKTVAVTVVGSTGQQGQIVAGKIMPVAVVGDIGQQGQDASAKTAPVAVVASSSSDGQDATTKTVEAAVVGVSPTAGQDATAKTVEYAVVAEGSSGGQTTVEASPAILSSATGSIGQAATVVAEKMRSDAVSAEGSASGITATYKQQTVSIVGANALGGATGAQKTIANANVSTIANYGLVSAGKSTSGSVAADASTRGAINLNKISAVAIASTVSQHGLVWAINKTVRPHSPSGAITEHIAVGGLSGHVPNATIGEHT